MELSHAIERFLSGYFATCRRSPRTHAAYKMDLDLFQAYFGADRLLDSVAAEHLELWATELAMRSYAPASIRRQFATLRVFYSYWVRKEEIEASPLWKIRLDLQHERKLPRSLSAVDAKRLVEYAWSMIQGPRSRIPLASRSRFLALRNLAIIELLFATGIRVGELVSLNLCDWREDEGSFLVKGKGSRQRLAVMPDERSLAAVRSYLSHRAALSFAHNGMFVNAAGMQLSTQGVARAIAKLAEGARIEMRVTPHMIRHTVATLLLRYGADIRVVQEVLGHASISMTERYTHVSKEHLRSTLHVHHPNHHLDIRCKVSSLIPPTRWKAKRAMPVSHSEQMSAAS